MYGGRPALESDVVGQWDNAVLATRKSSPVIFQNVDKPAFFFWDKQSDFLTPSF